MVILVTVCAVVVVVLLVELVAVSVLAARGLRDEWAWRGDRR